MEETIKILVLNPEPSQLNKTVKAINAQHKKAGPFALSILLGDVCSSATTELKYTSDVPVYYTEGENDQIELIKDENFNYLGKVGRYKLSNGLKLGFVNGKIESLSSEDIVNHLKGQDKSDDIDILITYMWPDAIAKEEKLLLCGDRKLDALIAEIKPKYWFSCGGEKGRFFERKPYRIGDRVTRFISLATLNEGRWWYAFQISLNEFGVNIREDELSEPPAVENHKRVLENGPLESLTKKQKVAVNPSTCFLCLSNTQFELHMIISIGKYSYLTVSKGPLTPKGELGFSGHGMIVPIEHFPILKMYSQENQTVENSAVFKEISMFQSSIVEMFKSLGPYCVCFWEISRQRSVHFHSQFVPIHMNVVNYFEKTLKGQIEFDHKLSKGSQEQVSYIKIGKDEDLTQLYKIMNSEDYVLFTVYEKFEVTRYLIPLGNDPERYFDAQFPRKVLAVLLNLKNRIHWKKCTETREQESIQKQTFKDKYSPFDIMKK